MTSHCGRLQLERYFGGELSPADKASVELHLNDCTACTAELAALQNNKSKFLAQHPFSSFTRAHAPLKTAPWHNRLWQLAGKPMLYPVYGALLVAIAVIPVVHNRGSGSNDVMTRFKGNAAMSYVYERNGKQFQAGESDTFLSGDKIQIVVSTTQPKQLALLSIDASGSISDYHPADNSGICSVPVKVGANQRYPGSIELDEADSDELVVALFTDAPLENTLVHEWITERYKETPELPELKTVLVKSASTLQAEIETLLLNKE